MLVGVTVLDHSDRTVTGLEKTDSTVWKMNNRQTIRYLSTVDHPVSLVVVFDASASVVTKIQAERNAIKEIIVALPLAAETNVYPSATLTLQTFAT